MYFDLNYIKIASSVLKQIAGKTFPNPSIEGQPQTKTEGNEDTVADAAVRIDSRVGAGARGAYLFDLHM